MRCGTLVIDSEEGREVVRHLVDTADVVVANMPPRTLAKLGLDYATQSAINPGIILAASTAFGADQRVGFDGRPGDERGGLYVGHA